MKKIWPLFSVLFLLTFSAVRTYGGTIFYVPIQGTLSDASCGISGDNGYTSAIDGGNTRGTDRVINGITLFSLSGTGQSSTADNCTLNALTGTLANGGGMSKTIQADGKLKEVLSDMTFNNGATDNSQQEIVLDPESLEEGATYDLRIYICNASSQTRQVNLAFFGDGQGSVETGFFNEDDARTSAGGFKDANQVYYINYRYTWDGDSTPGITVTQKSAGAPFCLYALTNQLVSEAGAAAAGAAGSEGANFAAAAGSAGANAAGAAAGNAAEGEEEGAAAGGEDEGLSAGLVDQESDEVGVESDDFYTSESLNSNGRWIKLSRWGTCWQPTNVASGWSPYTNGNWKSCDDCGWTFVSDEPWAWACYHYGRWCRVRTGCGWAWVPGKVWGASWVSWRQGREESCNCIGWAPLPPEAGCEIGIGVSAWVDRTCDIGPDYYNFIHIRDFGSDSYWGCGCIYERSRNPGIIIDTFNCTNIYYKKHVNIYCGGPDYNWCNTQIRKHGGKECEKIYVNRYDNPAKMGGKWAKREGNQLGLVSPRIHGEKNPKHAPKIAESLGSNKIDRGWDSVKDKKQARELRNHIAQETKGKTPRNSPGQLPSDVAEKLGKHHGAGGVRNAQKKEQAGAAGAGLDAGAGKLHPGGKGKRQGAGQAAAGGQAQAGAAGPVDQHPGKGKRRGQGQTGQAAGGATTSGGAGGQAGGFDQHPGGKGRRKGQGARAGQAAGGQGAGGGQAGGAGQGAKGNQAAAGQGGGRHPGQSLKRQKRGGGGGAGATGAAGAGAGQAGSQSGLTEGSAGAGQGAQGGRRKGRHSGGAGATGAADTTGAGQGAAQSGLAEGSAGAGQGGRRKGRHKQQEQQQQGQGQQAQGQTQGAGGGQQGGQAQAAGGGGGGGQHRKQQRQQTQQQQAQTQNSGQQGATGGGGGGRKRHQQQAQQQQVQQGQAQQQAGGGGGGGGRGRRQQQRQQQVQPAQQQVQPQQQQGGGQRGGKGKRRGSPTPSPY